MGRFGLCGPAYRSQSPNADAETSINWYSERVEQQGKSQYALYPCPGTFALFRGLGDGGVRAEITTRNSGSGINRTFQVIGSKFYEITFNPVTLAFTATVRGSGIINDGQRVSITAGPTQVLFASGGTPYVFDMVANTLVALSPAVLTNVSFVGYSDGFFIALQKNSNTLNTSKTLDATTWPPTNFTAVSVFTDNVLSMLVDHREIFLWGGSKAIVYYDSGNLFPFDPNPSGIIEHGIGAPQSPVKADNSVFWLNASERGQGIFFRTQGYLPVRISDHGVEQAISKYARIDDCVGYAMEDKGHTFIVWTFPSANSTWVYDVTTGFWHQRLFWNQAAARFDAHHSWGHTFNFNRHLISDPNTGNIYDLSQKYLTDDADLATPSLIRRERVAPQISKGREWIFFPAIEIYVESGLGPEPPLSTGTPSGSSNATLVQTTGGTLNTKASGSGFGNSIVGRAYQISVLIQNLAAVPLIVGGANSIPENVAPGAIAQVEINFVGDGSPLTMTFSTINIPDPTSFICLGTTILDKVTLQNLIPPDVQDFNGGAWLFPGGANPAITHNQPNPQLPPTPRDPQLLLSWSDDGCHTFSNEYALNCGQAGQYRKRAIKRRLGKSRGRNFKIAASDPIVWNIIDGYIPPAQERYTEQIRKVT